MSRPQRPLSGVERAWWAADRIQAPFVNQMVLEGEGTLDAAAWEAAVAAAGTGANLVARGWLGGTRWIDGGRPVPVRSVDARGWDGRGPEGAPWLDVPLHPRRGPAAEVVLMNGPTPRVAFRTHHALMDGRGTQLFAESVFRVLRGEPATAVEAWMGDSALVALRRPGRRPPTPEDAAAPTGPAAPAPPGTVWRRRSVGGRLSQVLPRTLRVVADLALQHGPRARIGIPVDLRPHLGGAPGTANLTGLVDLEIGPSETLDALAEAVAAARAPEQAARVLGEADALRHLPLGLLAWLGRRAARRALARGRFASSATVSNLGRVDPAPLTGGGFRTRRCFFIPPGNPGQPFFLTLTGHPEGLEVLATAPRALATDGRLEQALERIEAALHG